jgi:hypothetical protein
MKHLTLLISVLLISPVIFSQTRTENIKKGYLLCLGTEPNASQIALMNKNIDATSLNKVVYYLNNYIYKNRETVQKDIIRRAYLSVYKIRPDIQDVENLYNLTSKRSKNYTMVINELNIYFTSDIIYPY